MLRWKYIIPRLVIVTSVVIGIYLGLNPLLHWLVIHAGQAAIGAKVEVQQFAALLANSRLNLQQVAIADPQSPMQNVVEIGAANFDVDMRQLLQRRFFVHEGSLTGIQFGTARQESGALPGADKPEPTGPTWTDRATEVGGEWLESTAKQLGGQIENDLQSVQLGRDLIDRWPKEYDRLEADAKQVRERGSQLVEKIQTTKKQPLQSVEHYQSLLQEIDFVRREGLRLRQELTRLHQQMGTDRAAIQQAKAHDTEYVKSKLQLAKLDPEELTNYLLGPELAPRVDRFVEWIQWGRQQLVPQKPNAADEKTRGWNIVLPSMKTAPDNLIRTLLVDGGGTSGGRPFTFQGVIEDVTTQPDIYGRPATVHITTEGSVAMLISAVLDHTGATPRDEINIECPRLVQHARTLGKPNQLAVQIPASASRLHIQLKMTGDDLAGVIQVSQPAAGMQTIVSDKLGGAHLASRLTTATSGLRELETQIDLSGSLKRPRWKLKSNLGPQLAQGLQQAFQQELAMRQEQVVQLAHREVDQQLNKLQGELQQKQQELLAKLNLSGEQLGTLQQELGNLGIADKLLGEKGLLRKFKF